MRKAQLQTHEKREPERHQANRDCSNAVLHRNGFCVLAEDIGTKPRFRMIELLLLNFDRWDIIICIMSDIRHLYLLPCSDLLLRFGSG